MRKAYLLLLTLIVNIMAMAGPITPDEARQKITKFMNLRRSSAVFQNLRLVATNHYQEREGVMAPSFYVFNVGEDQGYIIAAADDRIPAVLGYSDRGSFDPEDIPVNMQTWLEEYNDQMEYLNRHPKAVAPQNTVSGGTISPLLGNIEWNQRNPYNSLCPWDGDKRSVTGCVATAMAQIMYYWRWPNQTTTKIPAYVTKDKGLSVSAISAGTIIDWANILPKYTGNETNAQINAIAKLMLMCGTAVQMNYSSEASSAYSRDVSKAWRLNFGYDEANSCEMRSNYRLAKWNQKVYNELKAGRPVFYMGQSSGGGHAFVIDGYGGNDYFHVNWGWGGKCNDYFLLSILDPHDNSGTGASSSTDGYSFDQEAIFGARPNTGTSSTVAPVMSSDKTGLPNGNKFTRSSSGDNFSFQVAFSYWNRMDDTYDFDYNVALYDSNDNFVGIFSDTKSYNGLKSRSGFSNAKFTVNYGKGLTSGTYKLIPISRQKGTSQWHLNKGYETTIITAKISSNTITLSEPKFGLTGSLTATGEREVDSPLNLTATITNNGSLYNGQIFLLVDGYTKDNVVEGRHFDIDPGQTKNVDFSFTPKTTGKKTLRLCTRDYNGSEYEYTPFITSSVTVNAASAVTLSMTPKTKNAVYEGGQYIVKGNKAIVSIYVKNTGNTNYNNDVIVKLYKYGNGNSYSSAGTFKKAIQLNASASTDVEIELDDLEDGKKYFYNVYYLSKGTEMKGSQDSPTFVVQIASVATATLTMYPKTKNAVYENGQYVVKENKAIVSIAVNNTGNTNYNNDVIVKLYKIYEENHGSLVNTGKKAIELAACASMNVEMEFDNLENEEKYFYYVYYLSEGNEVKGYQYSPQFVVQNGSMNGTVALVNDNVNCSSLKEALSKASTDGSTTTIKMMKDTQINNEQVNSGCKVILDLNGYTLSISNYGINNYGHLTIIDNKGNGKLIVNGGNCSTIQNHSELIIEGGTFINNTTEVSGTDYRRSIWTSEGSSTIIKDGSFTSPAQTLCFNGNATIENGDFICTGNNSVVLNYNTSGQVTITGGTFTNTGQTPSGTDYRRSIWTKAESSMVIKGGNFSSPNQTLCINGNATISGGIFENPYTGICCGSNGNVTITNGMYSGRLYTWDGATLKCSGGLYSKMVESQYLAPDCQCIQNDDESTKEKYPYRVKNNNESGISHTNADETEIVGIYNIGGHRLNSLQRGTNIIRMSNGKTKKVIVK